MRTISQVLDKAKKVQKVPSDYKLALTLGIGESALANYRHGRSMPDEKACAKLAAAIGEKPDLLMVEMQAQRTKDAQARAMWENLAKRLQAGFANVKMLAVLAIVSIATIALPYWLALYFASFSVVQSVYYVKSRARRFLALVAYVTYKVVNLCKAGANVPRNAHPAAVLPA